MTDDERLATTTMWPPRHCYKCGKPATFLTNVGAYMGLSDSWKWACAEHSSFQMPIDQSEEVKALRAENNKLAGLLIEVAAYLSLEPVDLKSAIHAALQERKP